MRVLVVLAFVLSSAACSTTMQVPGREITKLRTLGRHGVVRLSDGDAWVEVDSQSRIELDLNDGRHLEGPAAALRPSRDGLVLESHDGVASGAVRLDEIRRVVVHGRDTSLTRGLLVALGVGCILLVAIAVGRGDLRVEL